MPTLTDKILNAFLRFETAHNTHHEDASQQFNRISQQLGEIMADTSALKQAFEDYRSDVQEKVAALGKKVDALTAAVAANDDSASIAALTAEVTAAKSELDGAAATPPPADSGISTGSGAGTTGG